jgi:hypothetical protein
MNQKGHTMLIDDFTSGAVQLDLPTQGNSTTHVAQCQNGEMLGGGRYVALGIALNPRQQPAHLDVNQGYLNASIGAEQFAGVDLVYGRRATRDGECQNASLLDSGNGDFASMGGGIRTTLNSSSGLYGSLNFNVVVYTATGWASIGVNVSNSPRPITVDFRFEDGPETHRFRSPEGHPADFSRVGLVLFRFATWGDFVIDKLEVI